MQMRRTLALLSLVLSASLIFSIPSFAAPSPSPDPNPTLSAMETYLNALDKFKADLSDYFDALDLREEMREEINKTFASDVSKSTLAAKSATRQAISAASKSTILDQKKSAIQRAVAERDAAIAALGPMPVKPVEPIKPEGLMKLSPMPKKDNKEKKESKENKKG